jgi:hypothetical protein
MTDSAHAILERRSAARRSRAWLRNGRREREPREALGSCSHRPFLNQPGRFAAGAERLASQSAYIREIRG